MHVGKLMARLNPKNVRFDVGAGGIPELTSIDVAHALGTVSAGLGRELLCRMWWPAGASVNARQLDDMLKAVQLAEWSKREAAMYQGLAAIASHEGGDSLRRAQTRYQQAHADRWPKWVMSVDTGYPNPVYPRIRRAVLLEMADPRQCPTCGGSGDVLAGEVKRACERCEGRGQVAHGNTRRADELRILESTYRQTWARPYEWLLARCNDTLRVAANQLEAAVS